jgi:hypothetical protein
VITYWDNVLLVIGRQGDHINYSYDSAIRLVPEIDGVRVLSNLSHEMIQKVPLVVQEIFRINSTDPGSYLLEASKQFQVCVFFLQIRNVLCKLHCSLLLMRYFPPFCASSSLS